MAQLEAGPGRTDPALIPAVVSNVQHAGTAQANPTLATVTSAQSHPGVTRKFF